MFDLTSSKLLILAVVALLVVGPKDFPILLRTVGRYLGILRKHATEFRAQFDTAIREAELDQMRDEVEKMSRDIEKSVREADAKVAADLASGTQGLDEAIKLPPKRPDRVQIVEPASAATAATGSAGATSALDAASSAAPVGNEGTGTAEAIAADTGASAASASADAHTPATATPHRAETTPLPRPGAMHALSTHQAGTTSAGKAIAEPGQAAQAGAATASTAENRSS